MTTEHDVTDEGHRASCAECRQLWGELEAIGAEAARLPLLSPSRDLWQGIESRLDGPALAPQPPATRSASMGRGFRSPVLRMAVAASLLVAVTATATWQLAERRAAPSTLAVGDDTDADSTTLLHLASVTESVSQVDREIAALESILRDRSSGLDSATVAVLEANLAVIDAAIAESRAALAADPASQFLAEQYARAYTSKLSLLRDAATLPTGI